MNRQCETLLDSRHRIFSRWKLHYYFQTKILKCSWHLVLHFLTTGYWLTLPIMWQKLPMVRIVAWRELLADQYICAFRFNSTWRMLSIDTCSFSSIEWTTSPFHWSALHFINLFTEIDLFSWQFKIKLFFTLIGVNFYLKE